MATLGGIRISIYIDDDGCSDGPSDKRNCGHGCGKQHVALRVFANRFYYAAHYNLFFTAWEYPRVSGGMRLSITA